MIYKTDATSKKSATVEPKGKRALKTRQRILDAAAYWLNKKGLAQTSLQDFAEKVNLQTASLYYHFPSKDALIEEVLRIGIEVVYNDVKTQLEKLGPGASYRERIKTAVSAHLTSLLTHGDYTSANIRNFPLVSDSIREKNLTVRRLYGEYWRKLLVDAQAAGEIAPDVDLSLIRLLLVGSMNWSTEWFNPRKKSIANITDAVCNMLFDGIGTGPRTSREAKPRKPISAKRTS